MRGCGSWWSKTRSCSPAAVADGLSAEGFDVDVAHNGPDGLWRAREGSYDAIVLDVLLPGMHGYKVCRTLRDEGVWTPILILTAKDGEYDEAEALDTGADDFLSKPFSFVVLAGPAAGAHPPRRCPAADGAHASARLELDPGARRCRRNGDRRPTHRARVRAARVPHAQGRQRRVEGGDPRPRVGHRLRRRSRTSSRCTSATCARRSTQPFGVETIKTVRGAGYQLLPDVLTMSQQPHGGLVAADGSGPAHDRRHARFAIAHQPGRVRARPARAQQPASTGSRRPTSTQLDELQAARSSAASCNHRRTRPRRTAASPVRRRAALLHAQPPPDRLRRGASARSTRGR